MTKFSIGADPELFLTDAAGALISAIDRIGGSKEFPRHLPELGRGFAVQEDNVALEYNIPASNSPEELAENINKIMKYLREQVAGMGLQFSQASAAVFPEQQLMHPMALEFGCDPDFNAWTGDVNPKPKADDHRLRSCGGHVHIGTKLSDVAATIRRCDLMLGVPSTLQDNGFLRKSLYGKRGAFRPKPYGAEYRTLSNYWIFDNKTIEWVFKNTRLAVESQHLKVEEDDNAIFDAIDNNNLDAAKWLVAKYNIPMVV